MDGLSIIESTTTKLERGALNCSAASGSCGALMIDLMMGRQCSAASIASVVRSRAFENRCMRMMALMHEGSRSTPAPEPLANPQIWPRPRCLGFCTQPAQGCLSLCFIASPLPCCHSPLSAPSYHSANPPVQKPSRVHEKYKHKDGTAQHQAVSTHCTRHRPCCWLHPARTRLVCSSVDVGRRGGGHGSL